MDKAKQQTSKDAQEKSQSEPSSLQEPEPDELNSESDVTSPKVARKEGKNFIITKWMAQAMWSWDVAIETCAICRNQITEVCIECQANPLISYVRMNSNGCLVTWGKCQHVYHFHCISRWLQSRSVCPLDNQHWEYMKTE